MVTNMPILLFQRLGPRFSITACSRIALLSLEDRGFTHIMYYRTVCIDSTPPLSDSELSALLDFYVPEPKRPEYFRNSLSFGSCWVVTVFSWILEGNVPPHY